MNIIKRLRCKHTNKECMSNFYGDYINIVSYHNKIIRSVWRCKNCGKIIYSEYLDKDCNVVNWNLFRTPDGLLKNREEFK